MIDPFDPWHESKLRFAEMDIANQASHVRGDAYLQELLLALKDSKTSRKETEILEAIVQQERHRQAQIRQDGTANANRRHERARKRRG